MNPLIIQGIVCFTYVFLKGFQHQNVIGGKYVSAFLVSYGMAVLEVATVSLIISNGWDSVIPVGTGAAFGIVTSMYVYRKFWST